jgi:predicted nucleic acid-binding protein
MTEIMVDSNVLIDIFNKDTVWFEWSSSIIEIYAEQVRFTINPIIYAEISTSFKKIEELEDVLPESYFTKEPIPWEAAFLAAKVFVQYRKNGGKRDSNLPDFLIGAHAAVRGIPLITRDTKHYKTYYPHLELISP